MRARLYWREKKEGGLIVRPLSLVAYRVGGLQVRPPFTGRASLCRRLHASAAEAEKPAAAAEAARNACCFRRYRHDCDRCCRSPRTTVKAAECCPPAGCVRHRCD